VEDSKKVLGQGERMVFQEVVEHWQEDTEGVVHFNLNSFGANFSKSVAVDNNLVYVVLVNLDC